MRITISFDLSTAETGEMLALPEKWIKEIVDQIKHLHRSPAEQAQKQQERAELIKTQGGVLWRSFADFLLMYWQEIQEEFGNDVTAGQMNSSLDSETDKIHLSKSSFPTVDFQAKPDYGKKTADISMSVVHPADTRQTNVTAKKASIPCRFEVLGNKIILQLSGQTFHDGQTAARFIITTLLGRS